MRTILPLGMAFALVGFLIPLAAGMASGVELRDAALVSGGSPVLQNNTATVRLEDTRLGRLGPPTFVPEPGALLQLGSGTGLLVLLAERRRRRAAPDTVRPAKPSRVDNNAPTRRML